MKLLSLIRRALRPQLPPAVEKTCWKIADCSLPGTAHLRRGRICEDAVGRFVRDGLLGIAVSDGAGSAPQAALGSALAVRTALLTLLNHHLEICPITADNAAQVLAGTFSQTVNTLCDRAAEMGAEPRDLACTLIVVVASANFVFAAQVGDGAVVLQNDDGNLACLTKPTNGEFANETILMGCAPTMDVQIRSFGFPEFPLKSIAVFTDGLQRLALRMPPCEPHEPFFQPLFERLQCLTVPEMENFLQEFLDSSRVNARTDDDKTLVTAQIQ
jgi:hypothetical protein